MIDKPPSCVLFHNQGELPKPDPTMSFTATAVAAPDAQRFQQENHHFHSTCPAGWGPGYVTSASWPRPGNSLPKTWLHRGADQSMSCSDCLTMNPRIMMLATQTHGAQDGRKEMW